MQQSEFFGHLDELFDVDAGTICAETVLTEMSSWSSLTFVGLIALIDEEYGISLPPKSILACATAGELATCVANGLQHRAAA